MSVHGSALASQSPWPDKPYRYRDRPYWHPAQARPTEGEAEVDVRTQPVNLAAAREARQAKTLEQMKWFAVLRAARMSVAEAGAAVGVSPSRASRYEQWRLNREAGNAG